MSKTAKAFKSSHDPMFGQLAKEIAKAIERNKDGSTQKQQFEELVAAERFFKETLLSYRVNNEIYKRFIQLIRVVNCNILSARPYFRENGKTFSLKITPALKTKDIEGLKPFDINFHFIKFCKDNWIGLWSKKMESAYKRVERARTVLIENNFPLAVNRAKIFFRKAPKSHLSFMDMIEVSVMGVCAGIDKYTGPFLKNFVGVCIGRSVGNLIDANSETVMHFYPSDCRVIYRARSIRGRQGITDIVELTKAVNDSFNLDLAEGRTAPKQVSVNELSSLLNAASLISSDSNDGEEGCGVYNFTPDTGESAEDILERKQQLAYMSRMARRLPLINQKVLRLKGIEI